MKSALIKKIIITQPNKQAIILITYSQIIQTSQKEENNSEQKKKLRQILSLILITLVSWLNPEATLAIALIRLLFLLWDLSDLSHNK